MNYNSVTENTFIKLHLEMYCYLKVKSMYKMQNLYIILISEGFF